jgi:hypothetical protein
MFELLAPVFAVAGGLLAGVPIVLHMLRRTPAVRMPFSVVRFLSPTLPKTTKRSTIEHWPLLLLRILAVALIALAFARPFQRLAIDKAAAAGSVDRIAMLVDASASMRRDGLREAVAAEVQNAAGELDTNDALSISVYSESMRSLMTAEEWKMTDPASRPALIERAIKSWEPDWMATRTGSALLETADEVARETAKSDSVSERRVILITDFQEGSSLDELRSGKWPDSVKLDLRIVRPLQSGNAGLSLIEDNRTGKIRVRVTNSGDAAMTKYMLRTFDAKGQPVGAPLTAEVGGGQHRTYSMPDAVQGQPKIIGVELLGEPHAFDNVVDLPIDERGVIHVAHAGSTDVNNSEAMRYFLQRALDGNETDPIEVTDLLGADGVAVPAAPDVRLVFVTESIPKTLATSLEDVLKRDGIVVLALKSVEMAESVKSLLPPESAFSEADVKDYAMLGQIDFSSPLFATFADARFSDFSSIRFNHYRRLTLDEKQADAVRVVARFDSGSPAVLEYAHPSGGRIVVLATGWHPDDSQWALSSRFPPMIQRLVQMSSPRRKGHQLWDVGHRMSPAQLTGSDVWTLTRPDGTPYAPDPVTVAPDSNGNVAKTNADTVALARSVVLDQPGRWTLSSENSEGPQSVSLLVTVAASESRTEPLPAGQLQALGMSPDIANVRDPSQPSSKPSLAAQLDAAELESRQKFWRWLLLAGLGCLALEGIVSYALEKRQQLELAG